MPKPKRAVIRDDGVRYESTSVNDYKSDRPLIPSHHYRDPQGFCFDSDEFSQRPFIQGF